MLHTIEKFNLLKIANAWIAVGFNDVQAMVILTFF